MLLTKLLHLLCSFLKTPRLALFRAIIPYMAISPYYDQIWQHGYGDMVISAANISVYGKSTTNIAIWSKPLINQTIILEMRVKALQCHFFLCIFSDFLCIYMSMQHFANMALKLKILFLLTLYRELKPAPGLHLNLDEFRLFWNTLLLI